MNHSQFGDVVRQYERLIYTICYQFTKDHHIAEDLAQETFLSAYAHWQSCPQNAEKPWLARIATNKAKDYLKSAYNRRIAPPGEEGLPENGKVLYLQQSLPEDIAISREEAERIKGYIEQLKEPYHMVAVQFFLQERSVEEIAKQLNRPPKTVHTQIYRAKNILKLRLQESMKGEPKDGVV